MRGSMSCATNSLTLVPIQITSWIQEFLLLRDMDNFTELCGGQHLAEVCHV